jgi:hypothetical protein
MSCSSMQHCTLVLSLPVGSVDKCVGKRSNKEVANTITLRVAFLNISIFDDFETV